jgi:hypothetical protein
VTLCIASQRIHFRASWQPWCCARRFKPPDGLLQLTIDPPLIQPIGQPLDMRRSALANESIERLLNYLWLA